MKNLTTLTALIAERLATLADDDRASLAAAMTLTPMDAVAYLNLNAESFAMGRISLADSQRVYWAITPMGWRADEGAPSLAEKVAITTFVGAMLDRKIAEHHRNRFGR